MADNIYLLETRLSTAQKAALEAVREVARSRGLTVFLVGGAVRDLIGGTAVRDLDVVVQGNALKIKKELEKVGAVVAGEFEAGQAVFVRFPGGVRMEIGSTLTVTYPKPGKPVVKPATILEDLRRRDFTANAMALSLNEGSYGLLMDPLNGVADIENRELRLVSNYGFIEDPVRMIRAARLMARLGWGMEEKTRARYETGKAEGYISAMSDFHRGYETEEVFHEEDALRVMRRLEEEGWMQHLAPALSAAKANVAELERLRESQAQLQTQGVVADSAAANFPLLTAKMTAKEVDALKKSFPRPGFVVEIEELEAKGKEFTAKLGAKGAALPSQAYRLITSADPEAVLWTAHTTKSGALQAKFRSFYTEWPQARQRIPHLLMQEMRILPEIVQYETLVDKLFLELMDGKLGTVEEMKAYLEPFSPPAPPPPVSLRRPRAAKKDAKPAKSRKKVAGKESVAGDVGGAEGEAMTADAAAQPAPPSAAGDGSPSTDRETSGSSRGSKEAKTEVPAGVEAGSDGSGAGSNAAGSAGDRQARPAPVKSAQAKPVEAKPVQAKSVQAKSEKAGASQTVGQVTAGRGKSGDAAKTKAVPAKAAGPKPDGAGAKGAAAKAASAKRVTPAKVAAVKKSAPAGKSAAGAKTAKKKTGPAVGKPAKKAAAGSGSAKSTVKVAAKKGSTKAAAKKVAGKGGSAAKKVIAKKRR